MYNLINRMDYPQGEGFTRSTFTIARSLPTSDEPVFEVIEAADDLSAGGLCATIYNDVPVGYNERTYRPEKFGWQGPVICSDSLIYAWQRARFIPAYIDAMGKNTVYTINRRYEAIYDHLVPKAVAASDFEFTDIGTGFPGTSPNLTLDSTFCELTQEMLDSTAIELNNIGASEPPESDNWFSLGPDGPIYPLLIGQQMSQRLLLNNAELRQDYRDAFATKGELNPVIMRMGATRVIKNFRHIVVVDPPRYTYSAGAYHRVPTYSAESITKGTRPVFSAAYKAATHEGVRVLSPSVFYDEVIQPVNSVGSLSWPAKNYLGQWMFVTGGNKIGDEHCLDPLEKLGRHFAEFHHAPRPVKPEYGRLIIFRRCPASSLECVTCT